MHCSVWTKSRPDSVENANTRSAHKFLKNFSNDTDVTQQKFISQLDIQDETCIQHFDSESENKACNGTNESVKIVISVDCVTPFFHVICKQLTTAEMHKIYIAQKSYCACCVLSLATIRSKYYFNFIPNKTRSGREVFDRPSYIWTISSLWLIIFISNNNVVDIPPS